MGEGSDTTKNRLATALVIEVPNLSTAVADYCLLLRSSPNESTDKIARFSLSSIVIELREVDIERAQLRQLQLQSAGEERFFSSELSIADHFLLKEQVLLEEQVPLFEEHEIGLDMVVYMTADIEATRLQLASAPLGLKVRKSITIQPHGTELSFISLGKVTLELTENPTLKPGQASFWGLGFRVGDIDKYHQYLREQGVGVSEIRPGQKRHTRVASVKSHHLGLPTLLVGAAV